LTSRAKELLGDGLPIHGQGKGLPDPEVGEPGMGHLHAAALAIHLGQRVRAIETNILDQCTGGIVKDALTPLLFHTLPDVPINRRETPGEVELAGLNDGACGGGGIATPLQFNSIEEGVVGHVIGWIDLEERHISRLEVDEFVWPGAHRLEVIWRIAGV